MSTRPWLLLALASGAVSIPSARAHVDLPVAATSTSVQPVETGSTSAPPLALELDAAAAAADVRLLRRALAELHPGLGRYTSRPATLALADALEREVSSGITDAALLVGVQRVLASLRCDHTLTEPSPRLEAARRAVPSYLPCTMRVLDGRVYVDRVHDVAASSLARGDELTALNGVPTGRVLARVAPLVSVDGWTDHAVVPVLEWSNEILGGAIEMYGGIVHDWSGDWELDVRRPDGTERTVVVPALTFTERVRHETGGERWSTDFTDGVRHELVRTDRATIGYLAVDTFINYRKPVDPAERFAPVFASFAEAGVDRVVLDLRSCGGGSDDVPRALQTYLMASPPRGAKRPPCTVYDAVPADLREHLSSWEAAALDPPDGMLRDLGDGFFEVQMPLAPAPSAEREHRFEGPLTILTSPANASGATMLVALLREHRPDTTTIGAPTGGSAEGPTAGILLTLDLPASGIRVRIPVLRQWLNVERFEPGLGVVPDVEVLETVDDWRAGRDVVLEAALAP